MYELAQQAFALCQAVCGPLHRATAVALEFVAKALFNLGDPEVCVSERKNKRPNTHPRPQLGESFSKTPVETQTPWW